MAYGFSVTAAGWRLLAGLLAGDTLEISRIMVGSGRVSDSANPADLTDLIAPVARAESTAPVVDGRTVSFVVEYRSDLNGGLQEGFWLNEFGVFANDVQGGEVLLYYGTLGDYPQYVSAYTNGNTVDIRRYPVSIVLTDELEVVFTHPPLAFVTWEEAAPIMPKYQFIRIDHGLGCYPQVMVATCQHSAGISGAGKGPAGGTDMESFPAKPIYHGRNSLTIKTVKPVVELGSRPTLHRLSATEYAVTFADNPTTSVYIQLLCSLSAGTPSLPTDAIAIKNIVFSTTPPSDTSVLWGEPN